jgi:hypothetical protein
VGGKVVYGAGEFAAWDEACPPPPMPDWSPVRRFGGYGAWGEKQGATMQAALRRTAIAACACSSACRVHGHDHLAAASRSIPAADLRSFWGVLGCACWAV